ncbi:hypothetical protein B0H94_104174 [Salsuginibacillus halophilus]|uniref:YviE n=1 Tax=Salsuginibacillus halophilus TaxID=517424 RepID=A0A2P8HQS5_9BACI|nr:DUF6470 family protein [Salsuginibacillus halophilus]PSL48573.1 hypothetical protein B0H94_104174 [Salsuginibacillus halophilus]
MTNVPEVQITTTDARLGLDNQRPPMQMEQPSADIDIIHNHVDTVNISTEAMQLNIDQTEAFAAANLIAPLRSSQEFSAEAEMTAIEYVQKTARHGEQMKDSAHTGASAIPNMAHENWMGRPVEVDLGYMPDNMDQTQIDFQPGEVHFQIDSAMPEFNVETRDPIIEIPRWEVNTYMEQKPSIQFDVPGRRVDQSL